MEKFERIKLFIFLTNIKHYNTILNGKPLKHISEYIVISNLTKEEVIYDLRIYKK